jgi:tetratricopeptide (TPR) repeat protein
MKRLTLVAALLVSAFAAPAAVAGPTLGGSMPDKPFDNLQMIYSTDPALQCYRTARDGTELRFGLEHCNTAVIDPLMNYRAQTFVNRGIIRYDMGDHKGALNDFKNALNYNPALGDAYLNQALVLVSEKRPDEAMAAINQGIALGATNLQVAYYSRAMIEDDAGRYAQAYRDYKQALMIKPDYGPAQRQLARFKVVPKGTPTQ